MLPTAVDGPRFAARRRLHNGVPVLKRASVASLAALLLLAAASADAGSQGEPAGATARAQAIRIVVPGQTGAATPAVSAPTDQVLFSGGFTYGEDPTTHAPMVSTGSANASASTSTDVEADATAAVEVNNLNVFNGEITATSIVAQAHATARRGVAKGDSTGTAVNGLLALGQSLSTGTVALADWGSLTAVSGGGSGSPATGYHGSVAALGAPILAVAAGTVFSVGWNKIGGNRLWLRDGQGNLFYYAHLSAFTPLAVNGNKVNAGDVLGFVGNTGDAQGTPTHLHFEIHPVGLIGLGYDGAVNPTTYLLAWKHLQDVSFAGGDAWAPQHSLGNAPKPGAILLNVFDISSADGLVPGSLERVIRPVVVRGDNFSARP